MSKIETSAPVQQIHATPTSPAKTPEGSMMMPESTFVGDPVATALALIAKFARNSKELSGKLKQVAAAQKRAAQAREVSMLRKKADQLRSAGFVQASLLGASACMKASAVGLNIDAHNKMSKGADGALSQTWAQGLSDLGGSVEESAKVVDKFADANATLTDADATAAKNDADHLNDIAEAHGDDAKNAEDIAQKALEAIRAVFQAKHTAEMAVLHRLG